MTVLKLRAVGKKQLTVSKIANICGPCRLEYIGTSEMKYCLMILYTATLFGTIALLIEFSIKVTQVCALVRQWCSVLPLLSSTTAVVPHSKGCLLLPPENTAFAVGSLPVEQQDTGPKAPGVSPTLQGNSKQVGVLLTPAGWAWRGAD